METLLGLLFAVLWASATIATKFIGRDTAPLTVLAIRFVLAAGLLFVWNYALRREARPRGAQWRHLAVLGFTNSTAFLGASWLAIRAMPVGVYQLLIACGPFVVAVLSMVWLKRAVVGKEWLGMGVAALGLVVVVAPSLGNGEAAPVAIGLTVFAMLANAFGTVYARASGMTMKPVVLNNWQLVFGLIFLLPFSFALNDGQPINFTPAVVLGLLWVVFAVSIGAMVIWFYLVRLDPLRASNWLFLTPIFSYAFGALLLGEPIQVFDVVGGVLVFLGLMLSGALVMRRSPEPARAMGKT